MTDAPERIWAYHAPELAEDNPGCTIIAGESSMKFSQEYIRADLVAALQAENRRLREVLETIATTGRCEFAVVRAALRSTEASHDD